ncbi:MAG: yrrB 4, partial [Planctomycetaceae bacterium]|nr:yrrB 4 [Planctomycetaceae bacterium]
GGPVVSPGLIAGLRTAMVIVLVVITSLFVAHTIRQTWRGNRPSPLKLALMLTTFGYYWYCLASVSNLLVSYALFELFHDAQYLTIVWAFNARRAEKDAGAGGFTRFLFRRRGALVACYLVLIVAYGLLSYGTRELLAGPLQQALLGIFLASTVLHYYYDGFIWKLRETDTQRTLDLAEGSGSRRGFSSQWLKWSLMAAPICGLIWLTIHEAQHPTFGLEKHDALVAALPDSVYAHHNRGIALAAVGRLDAAEDAQRRALQLNSQYADIHYDLGTVHLQRGADDAARLEFQRTLKLDPLHVEASYNLGVMLLKQGRYREALPLFQMAARRRPRKAEIHNNLGSALVMAGRNKEAISAFRRALDIAPDSSETHNNLAQALAADHDPEGALVHYRRAAELQPASAIPRFNLGVFFESQNRLDDAIAAYRESLRIDASSADAWNNLGVVLARKQQFADAAKAFHEAVHLAPNHVSAVKNLQRATSMLERAEP